jgi:hypothetical protein
VTLLASVQLYRWSPKDASYFTCDGVFSSNFAARQPGIAKCDFSPKSQILTKKRMTARLSVASGRRRRIGNVSSFVNPDVAQVNWREDADAEVARRGVSATPADFNVNIDNQKRI